MPFDSPVEGYVDEVEERVTKLVRRIALTALKGVISASPVQDGPFRGNHHVGLTKPDHSSSSAADKSGRTTQAMGERKIGASESYPTIWISNAMPYANRLENGWSKIQAPRGIYSVTFTAVMARFAHELRDA